jgi:hypothetical protein
MFANCWKLCEFPPGFKLSRKIKSINGLFYNCHSLYLTDFPSDFWPKLNFYEYFINMSNAFNTSPPDLNSTTSLLSGILTASIQKILWDDKTKNWVVDNVFPPTVTTDPVALDIPPGWFVSSSTP